MRIGVISDTHGLLRPEAAAALAGSERILHIGDVDQPGILEALAEIAPVDAVRGNCDYGAWADALPMRRTVDLGGVTVHMVHRPEDVTPEAVRDADLILTGHSHKPHDYMENGARRLNPGSAGPRRFSLPITLAILDIDDGRAVWELVHLG